MNRILLLSLAGVAGTLTRYLVSGWVARRFGETFPTGTLVVNLVGCFLIGFLYHQLEERALIDPALRTAILIGFLGALTTFSSYGLQTFTLLRDGEFFLAGFYVLVSNLAGFLLVWIGYNISRFTTVAS
ncbi:MAG: fluoride efflux transporter CrcB [Acidobacteriota bacterium]|nr:MAG: fluoride efflux transporter CrcB [Acidobacteriota bacterium]